MQHPTGSFFCVCDVFHGFLRVYSASAIGIAVAQTQILLDMRTTVSSIAQVSTLRTSVSTT